MIPVNILVIAPHMGQHALDVSVMSIPNATVYELPDDLHMNHTAKIFNSVKLIQSALPFSAKLHETQMVMHVPPSPNGSFFSWGDVNLAWFSMPEQDIAHGTNTFQVTADLNVLEDTDDFVHWSFALTLGGCPYGTTVYIVGQPKLTALGFLSMDLTMGKKLNCTYVPSTDASAMVQNSATFEEFLTARRLSGVRGMGPVTLTCEDDGEVESDYIDAILQNFTRDLARTTTTTTSAPTTIAPKTTVPPATTVPATTTAANATVIPATTTAANSTTVAPVPATTTAANVTQIPATTTAANSTTVAPVPATTAAANATTVAPKTTVVTTSAPVMV
jgi:hypothetical protein